MAGDKPKMGRPFAADQTKVRRCRVSTSVTEAEKWQIAEIVASEGGTEGSWVYRAVQRALGERARAECGQLDESYRRYRSHLERRDVVTGVKVVRKG